MKVISLLMVLYFTLVNLAFSKSYSNPRKGVNAGSNIAKNEKVDLPVRHIDPQIIAELLIPFERKSIKTTEAYPAELVNKIKNDKEVMISSFDKDEIVRIKEKFSNENEKQKIKKIFTNNLYTYLNRNVSHCELKYISNLFVELFNINIKWNEDEMTDIFKMLRVENTIDDIFFDILVNVTKDYYALEKIDLKKVPSGNVFKNYEKKAKDYNIEEVFSGFKKFPDEIGACSYQEFVKARDSLGGFKDSRSDKVKILKNLAMFAFENKIIPVKSYNEIMFLSDESTIGKRKIWMNDYLRIIFFAKDKMIPFKRSYKVINLGDENVFSSERIKHFSRITRRKILFQKYDESQIILLSQVMKKASRRMGVDPDSKTTGMYIVHEYQVEEAVDKSENFVERIEIDTQSQFNLARRLLRKDMVALQMMDSFQKINVTYEDLVVASLETGYISLDDIEYVVKYDDLWNPEISKIDRIVNITFRIIGYGTFVLPPPWNITAALALSIVEGIVDSKNINGASNDNPNTFIE